MDILEKAKAAMALIAEGRAALTGIVDAVKDGRAAVSAHDEATIDQMLEAERAENRATFQDVKDAIAEYRAGQ